ncbi:unnamed protein product [Effrenium voratum]|uniref:Uncharacterized protein n=1 Tax=Effrenium voratum TaxID=2562239 RepID=A0AA36NBN2_9DINO|nr:unnamed protein product [Effrenium voratum]CAJ1419896.1 unnamed protein product [Effrenium voratum]
MELVKTRLCEWTPSAIDALAFQPVKGSERSQRLAVGRASGALELWDTGTWHLLASSPGKARRSFRTILWLEGRLISGGLHREITEWDPETLEPIESLASGGGAIWALCAAGSKTLCAACDDGTVRVVSLEGGVGSMMYARRINVASERILSLASEGSFVFAGGSDSRITKWSLETGVCEGGMKLERPPSGQTLVWSLVSLQDSMLASGDSLGLVQIWDTVASVVLHRFVQHQGDVLALAASRTALLSGGIDAKVSFFARGAPGQERWVFRDAHICHKHDIRAIALEPQQAPAQAEAPNFVSGGVAGRLFVKQGQGRPRECSAFSPLLQKAWVAQASRLVLCQEGPQLQLWFMKETEKLEEDSIALPEAQLVMTLSLAGNALGPDGTKRSGEHLAAAALTEDGKVVAASDMMGTRVFEVSVEHLQVQRLKGLPPEVANAAARALQFCRRNILAIAVWHGSSILLLDCKTKTVVATFLEHQSPVTLLAASLGKSEWLLSADLAGQVHAFSLDSLQHHAAVPGSGDQVTALGFDASGKKAVLVTARHQVMIFDVKAKGVTCALEVAIPQKFLAPHARVCGLASFQRRPRKLLLWGHGFLLAMDLDLVQAEPAEKGGPWKVWPQRHILGLASVAGPWAPLTSPQQRRESEGEEGDPPVVLTVKVSQEAVDKALPLPFERKKYLKRKELPT